MELLRVIKERRSIRRFKRDEIDVSLVRLIIEQATWSPSACNRQLWRFIIITDKSLKENLVNIAGSQDWILKSPVTIAVFYHKYINREHAANIQSASAIIQNILLLAHDQGLGSLWIAAIGDPKKTNYILKVPETFIPIAFITLGYPDESPIPPKRRKSGEIIGLNKFPDGDYPHSVFPDDWSLESVRDFQEKSSRSSLFGHKYRKYPPYIVEIVKHDIVPLLKGSIFDLFSYDGHLLSVSASYNVVISYEMSTDVIRFTRAVLENRGLNTENVSFIAGGRNLPLRNNAIDNVTIFFKMEILNKRDRAMVVNEILRILKPGGHLYVLYRNKLSLGWLHKLLKIFLMRKNSIDNHYLGMYNLGPYYALSEREVENALRGFTIKKKKGYCLIPRRTSVLDVILPLCEFQLLVAQK